MKPPKTSVCPQCGFKGRKPNEIVEEEGELELVKKGAKKAKKDDKQKVFSELLAIQREKGYSDGWTSHQYKKYFGVWPVGLMRECIEPSPEMYSWIRSQQIRYAKGIEKYGVKNAA